MKIFSVLTTNNEADILRDCLLSAIEWSDRVYVFDTGSTDSTPDVLKELSEEYEQIVYYKSEFRDYDFLLSNNEVFSHYFGESTPGDWWCLLSTDEFFADNVRPFLSRVPSVFDCVWDLRLNFYFTEIDYERFKKEFRSEVRKDTPSMHRFYRTLRYYKADYSEPRFFRHNSYTNQKTLFIPSNFKCAWFDRIINFHYQYRYPAQITRRVLDRQSIYSDSEHLRVFQHEMSFGRSTVEGRLDDNSEELLLQRVVDSCTLNRIDEQHLTSSTKVVVEHELLAPIPLSSGSIRFLLSGAIRHVNAKLRLGLGARVDRLYNIARRMSMRLRG